MNVYENYLNRSKSRQNRVKDQTYKYFCMVRDNFVAGTKSRNSLRTKRKLQKFMLILNIYL
jgi:hypothetical protein